MCVCVYVNGGKVGKEGRGEGWERVEREACEEDQKRDAEQQYMCSATTRMGKRM